MRCGCIRCVRVPPNSFLEALADALKGCIEHRHQEDSDRTRGDHAAEHGGARRLVWAAPLATTKSTRPRMKATEVIITARKRI